MKFRNFVCPHDSALFGRLRDCALTVHVRDAAQVATVAVEVAKSGNQLTCVIVSSELSLGSVPLTADCGSTPIMLRVPTMGTFRALSERLAILKTLNVTVLLPPTRGNLTALQVLASIGIRGGVVLGDEEPDWEALSDLVTYALLGSVPHAPIEPFAFIAHHYDPATSTHWGSVYFDDPAKYLHLDSQGRVALSHRELLAGEFVAQDVASLEAMESFPPLTARLNQWRDLFSTNQPCSTCAGWKTCLGRFGNDGRSPQGCSSFVAELMEVVEQSQALRKRA